jgi:anti-anti-sigma regulatory factor
MTTEKRSSAAPPSDAKRQHDTIIDLEGRLRRRGEALASLQLITRTFTSLTLTDRGAICDTLNSMVSTFLEVRAGVTVLVDAETGAPAVAGVQGLSDRAALTAGDARGLWIWLMEGRVARTVAGAEVLARWPGAPAVMHGGLACVSLDIHDRPIGLIALAGRISGQEFSPEDLELLSAVAGIAAMALTNAEAHAAQEALIHDVERQAAEAMRASDAKEKALNELDQKLEIIEQQRFAIQELSTPVLQLWTNVLAMPIIGVVDSRRSAEIMERLLSEITARQSRFVILDITGVEIVDTKTADHFIKVIKAAELLGTRCILTGIRPAVAQTLVEIGVDLSSITTLRTLQDGLRECLRQMGQSGMMPQANA